MVVADPTALKYILYVSETRFPKPKDVQKLIGIIFGKGLSWAPSGS